MSNEDKFLDDDLAILGEFVDESEHDLNTVADHFLKLESAPEDLELLNAIFRPVHSIKGNSAFLGLMQVRQLAHEMENLLDDLRKQRLAVKPEIISVLLAGIDELKAMLARIRRQEPEVADEAALQSLVESIRRWHAQTSATAPAAAPPAKPEASATASAAAPPAKPVDPSASAPPPSKPEASAAAPAPGPAREIARTIRVAEKHLDNIETVRTTLLKLQQALSAPAADPAALVRTAAALVAQTAAALGEQLNAMRSVPASDFLQRAHRIARETAVAMGKTVKVNLAGEDLRLPKSMAEALETPLMHMVRNAVDHGIESAADRRRAGKPEAGQLWVELRVEDAALILRVADDGGGIDFRGLLAKAMAQNLLPRGRQLTPEDVSGLIFLPGLSSAKQVTDVSGRGVGMDVVKSQVEQAGGRIQVASKPGKGAEFIVRLERR